MCELDGPADVAEQSQPLLHRQILLLAEAGERNAVDILHRQIRFAVFSHAAIEQPRYEWVYQPCEDLPLLQETITEKLGRQRQVDQLDRHLLLELAIFAVRQIDAAHTAATQEAV